MSQDNTRPWFNKNKKTTLFFLFLSLLLIFTLVAMLSNYSFPHFFNLLAQENKTVVNEELGDDEQIKSPPQDWPVGLMTADTMISMGDKLFSNWLPNDKIYPTILLDNPQNFQLGALEMIRFTAKSMRDSLVRSGSSDAMDKDCADAFILLSNDPHKWLFPSAESRFNGAINNYRNLRERLINGEAKFSPRHDNLQELISQYMSLLGDVNNKLANAPHNQRTKSVFTSVLPSEAKGEQVGSVKVPWRQLDDNFYYAQGAAYVLRQMMVAIKYDFAKTLETREATQQVDSIIAVLQQTQFEPLLVLNGDVGSITANHSMELHSLLENTRQRLRNLEEMLGKAVL